MTPFPRARRVRVRRVGARLSWVLAAWAPCNCVGPRVAELPVGTAGRRGVTPGTAAGVAPPGAPAQRAAPPPVGSATADAGAELGGPAIGMRRAREALARAAVDATPVPSIGVVMEREVASGTRRRAVEALRLNETTFAFGVVDVGTGAVELVGPPVEDCKKARLVSDHDINGDGVPDFQFSFLVPSNRYPIDVEEGAIYLSDPVRHSYCLAQRLHDVALPSGKPLNAEDLKVLKEHAGEAAFHCAGAGH